MRHRGVLVSPVRAKAGGDLIRLTVFVLDSEGNGIYDRKVSLTSKNDLEVKDMQVLTDESGKSFFDIGSKVKGSFELEVFVDGLPLNQSVKLAFD